MKCLKITIYDWSDNLQCISGKLLSTFYSTRFIFPSPYAIYMYKIMILLNAFSSEISWPISTKFHVDPAVETGLRICSNGHASLTVLPIYGKIMTKKKKKKKKTKKKDKKKQKTFFFFKTKTFSNDDPFISCNGRIGKKMLHNLCIFAVAIPFRWASRGPWASCCCELWFLSGIGEESWFLCCSLVCIPRAARRG